MKKFTALVVISMFVLAAFQPLNFSVSGEAVDVAVNSINELHMGETEGIKGAKDIKGINSKEFSHTGADSSQNSGSQYSIDIWFEEDVIVPEELTLHEDLVIAWTNNDTVSYAISILKMNDSSDDYLDDRSDDSYNDTSYNDSTYSNQFTVEPGQTISFTLPDSGIYQITISDGMISYSGTIYAFDGESDDYDYDGEYTGDYDDDSSYDEYDDDDDSYDDDYDDDYDDSYNDSSDDSYNDSDEYDDDGSYDDDYDDDYGDDDDEEDDSEEEDDSHSALFMIAI